MGALRQVRYGLSQTTEIATEIGIFSGFSVVCSQGFRRPGGVDPRPVARATTVRVFRSAHPDVTRSAATG